MTKFDGGQLSRPQYLSLSLICGHAPPPHKLGGHKRVSFSLQYQHPVGKIHSSSVLP
jgi:hypothetical protein